MKKKLTALVDGDIYIFKAAAASEHPVQWDEDLWTLHAHMSDKLGLKKGDPKEAITCNP